MHIKFTRPGVKYDVTQIAANESSEADIEPVIPLVSAGALYLYYEIKEKVPLSLQYLMRMSAYEIWILSHKTYYFVITENIATRFRVIWDMTFFISKNKSVKITTDV